MGEGFISLHRKIWENPISHKPNYISVWLYVLSHANFKDKEIILNGVKTNIKRGSYCGSIAKIAEHFKLSRSVVKKIIDYFESDGMLYTTRTRSHTVFTVLNYDDYQNSEHRKNTARTPRATTNKDNKDNNDNNIIIDDLFNEFWTNYPDLGNDGKRGAVYKGVKTKAKTIFEGLIKKGENHERIIKGCVEYRKFIEGDGARCCHATTWLNQRRWETDYSTSATTYRPQGTNNNRNTPSGVAEIASAAERAKEEINRRTQADREAKW